MTAAAHNSAQTDFGDVLKGIGGIRVCTASPLRAHTSFRIGGEAQFLADVSAPEAMAEAVRLCGSFGVPCRFIGGGTNLLASDSGASGLVLRWAAHSSDAESVECGSGTVRISLSASAPLSRLAVLARENGAVGWAALAGIPGTVGGAVAMNAGTRLGSAGDFLTSADLVSLSDGKIRSAARDELSFSYRRAVLPPCTLVSRAAFQFRIGSPDEVLAEKAAFEDAIASRRRTQPREPSAGCAFVNPPAEVSGGLSAGALIDRAGLRGAQAGGAQISPVHANFIVNLGGASASDVLSLMRTAQEAVFDKFGVRLVPEIRLLGEFPEGELPVGARFSPNLTLPADASAAAESAAITQASPLRADAADEAHQP